MSHSRVRSSRLYWAAALALIAAPALAADTAGKGPSEAVFVAQIVVLMIVGRLLGEAMLRIGQPAVVGQLVAGLLLGPSLFGWLMPDLQHALFPAAHDQKAMLDAIAQFGILLLLLLTGMETDLKLVRQSGRAAAYASLMGVVVPFVCGVALGEMLPDSMLPDPQQRLITALFLGTALSIASLKIAATVVREMNFTRRIVGQVIVSAAIIDDALGWIAVSIIFSLALYGAVDAWTLTRGIIGTILFLAASLTVGRRLVFFVIRWVNDNFASEFAVITAILVIMGSMALITDAIGVHSVLGAFVAGVLVGESPILTRHIGEQLRGLITAFFAPVFFGVAGLSADLTVLANPEIALLTVALVAIASLGKFGGAFIGAGLGGLTRQEGLALACGMNARGSTEVIIATVGLSLGTLNQNLFTMIVAMAVITTMAMPPTLRWALARVPIRAEEKKRLDREEMDAKGFVPNLERLLIAVDDSANGKFASRLAGVLAGTRSMPTTVLHIAEPAKIDPSVPEDFKPAQAGASDGRATQKRPQKKEDAKNPESQKSTKAAASAEAMRTTESQEKKAKRASAAVKAAAAEIKRQQDEAEKIDTPIDVTTIVHEAPSPEFIAQEARKGYDLLVIGLKTTGRGNDFDESVMGIARGFEGPLAITDVRGELKDKPDARLNLLVPVNGTEAARCGAEVAITLARATQAAITVLYVAPRSAAKHGARRGLPSHRHEEAILKDIVAIADGYNMSIRTTVVTEDSADEAILGVAEQRKNNLIVIGVGRRPGERLFLGDTAASLLESAECSLLFVAS